MDGCTLGELASYYLFEDSGLGIPASAYYNLFGPPTNNLMFVI
jgi:hypothetical protein